MTQLLADDNEVQDNEVEGPEADKLHREKYMEYMQNLRAQPTFSDVAVPDIARNKKVSFEELFQNDQEYEYVNMLKPANMKLFQ